MALPRVSLIYPANISSLVYVCINPQRGHTRVVNSENCAAIYRLTDTSHIPSSGGGMASNLTQSENQAMVSVIGRPGYLFHTPTALTSPVEMDAN